MPSLFKIRRKPPREKASISHPEQEEKEPTQETGAVEFPAEEDQLKANEPAVHAPKVLRDRDDVRSLYIRFILAFISNAPTTDTKTTLLTTKDFVSGIFKTLDQDSHALISNVLLVMQTHVISDSALTKSVKIGLFNNYVLESLVKLYDVDSPQIRTETHDFLITLCTTTKGIWFSPRGVYIPASHKRTTPSSETTLTKHRTSNPILKYFLPKLHPEDELQRDLLLKIMEHTPDLRVFYTSTPIPPPTASPQFLLHASILHRILSLHIPIHAKPPTTFILDLICPLSFSKVVQSKGLQHKGSLVRFVVAGLLVQMLKAVGFVVELYRSRGWDEAVEEVLAGFGRRVVDVQVLVKQVNLLSSGSVPDPALKNQLAAPADATATEEPTKLTPMETDESDAVVNVEGETAASPPDFILLLLNIIKAYFNLLPHHWTESRYDFSKLLKFLPSTQQVQQDPETAKETISSIFNILETAGWNGLKHVKVLLKYYLELLSVPVESEQPAASTDSPSNLLRTHLHTILTPSLVFTGTQEEVSIWIDETKTDEDVDVWTQFVNEVSVSRVQSRLLSVVSKIGVGGDSDGCKERVATVNDDDGADEELPVSLMTLLAADKVLAKTSVPKPILLRVLERIRSCTKFGRLYIPFDIHGDFTEICAWTRIKTKGEWDLVLEVDTRLIPGYIRYMTSTILSDKTLLESGFNVLGQIVVTFSDANLCRVMLECFGSNYLENIEMTPYILGLLARIIEKEFPIETIIDVYRTKSLNYLAAFLSSKEPLQPIHDLILDTFSQSWSSNDLETLVSVLTLSLEPHITYLLKLLKMTPDTYTFSMEIMTRIMGIAKHGGYWGLVKRCLRCGYVPSSEEVDEILLLGAHDKSMEETREWNHVMSLCVSYEHIWWTVSKRLGTINSVKKFVVVLRKMIERVKTSDGEGLVAGFKWTLPASQTNFLIERMQSRISNSSDVELDGIENEAFVLSYIMTPLQTTQIGEMLLNAMTVTKISPEVIVGYKSVLLKAPSPATLACVMKSFKLWCKTKSQDRIGRELQDMVKTLISSVSMTEFVDTCDLALKAFLVACLKDCIGDKYIMTLLTSVVNMVYGDKVRLPGKTLWTFKC